MRPDRVHDQEEPVTGTGFDKFSGGSMKRIGLATVVALALVLVALSVPAQAVGPPSSATAVTERVLTTTSRRADVNVGWTGYYIRFNRTETRAIAAGAGSCSVVVGKLPALPARVLSAACGLLAVLAGYALSDGRCLSAGVYYWGQPHFGTWRC